MPNPDSLVNSIRDLRTGVRWFDIGLGQYSFQGLMIVIATGFIPLTAFHCLDNGFLGKQPVAWKEYYAEYWLNEFMKAWKGDWNTVEKHHTIISHNVFLPYLKEVTSFETQWNGCLQMLSIKVILKFYSLGKGFVFWKYFQFGLV